MGITSRHRIYLAAFCALMWLPGLPSRTLWPNDEPRYALIARDMVENGDYVVPTNQGKVYSQKPPLFLWAEVASSALMGGVSEVSVRIPSVAAGIGTVLLTHAMGCILFTPGAGLLAGLVMATTSRTLLSAQWAAPDMLLCFFITASFYGFLLGHRTGRRGGYLAMYVCAALGTLTKGPMALIIPGLAIPIYLLLSGRRSELPRMRPLAGFLVMALLIAPWLVMFGLGAGGGAAANLLLKQTVVRYASAWNNVAPWYFYLWHFPLDCLPWTMVLAAAVAAAWRWMDRADAKLLLAWFGVVFLFFSGSTGKRGVYILPLYPAVALCVGWFGSRCLELSDGAAARRWLRTACVATAVPFLAIGILLLRPGTAGIPLPVGARGVAAGLAAGCLVAATLIAVLPPRRSLYAIAGSAAALNLAAVLVVSPLENHRQNVVPFAASIRSHVPEDAPLGFVRQNYETLAYYSDRTPDVQLGPGRRLEEWLGRSERVYAVLDEPAWKDLASHEDLDWKLLDRQKLSGEDYYLIVSR